MQRSNKYHHAAANGRNTQSESKFGTALKPEVSRKFGEYEGGEAADALFAPGIWGENPCKYNRHKNDTLLGTSLRVLM